MTKFCMKVCPEQENKYAPTLGRLYVREVYEF